MLNGFSYELRGIVDGHYVIRRTNPQKNLQCYIVMTESQLAKRNKNQRQRFDNSERNAEIYERRLSGETYAELAREFCLSSTGIRQICARRERMERRKSVV